jgi:transposase
VILLRGRSVRVFARSHPTDLRKGFAGLSALVREGLGRDPTSGDLYLFVSRSRTRAKVLAWDGTGLCLLAKRLERGRFVALWERVRAGGVELSVTELELFLEGCQLVGRGPISPPEINPKRLIAEGLSDTVRTCSTSPVSATSRS